MNTCILDMHKNAYNSLCTVDRRGGAPNLFLFLRQLTCVSPSSTTYGTRSQ
jgi:hypothetical protein